MRGGANETRGAGCALALRLGTVTGRRLFRDDAALAPETGNDPHHEPPGDDGEAQALRAGFPA